jgi:hypothetical protein
MEHNSFKNSNDCLFCMVDGSPHKEKNQLGNMAGLCKVKQSLQNRSVLFQKLVGRKNQKNVFHTGFGYFI